MLEPRLNVLTTHLRGACAYLFILRGRFIARYQTLIYSPRFNPNNLWEVRAYVLQPRGLLTVVALTESQMRPEYVEYFLNYNEFHA